MKFSNVFQVESYEEETSSEDIHLVFVRGAQVRFCHENSMLGVRLLLYIVPEHGAFWSNG